MAGRLELTGLTALRLLAALFVLLFHSRYFAEGGWLEIPVFALFSSGWLGVDIFFVLSGFVISYVYSENLRYFPYLLRRFARIYPAYFLSTIAALAVISVLGRPSFSTFNNFDVLMNFVMLQGWYASWQNSVNFVSWSVSAEWAAYLLFPFLLWVVRLLPVNWLGIMLPVSIYAFFAGLEWTGLGEAVNKCIFEFSSGIMLFRFWNKFGGFGEWIRVAAVVSFLCLLTLESWFAYFGFPLEGRYLALFAVPVVAWAVNWKAKNPLLLLGGRASYSIYLVHGVIYMLLRRSIDLGLLDRAWGLPLFWLLSIGIAYASYLWIEKPARHWIISRSFS
jgi:peptidoglycan/LPS O-acetylase OafA/YrhL